MDPPTLCGGLQRDPFRFNNHPRNRSWNDMNGNSVYSPHMIQVGFPRASAQEIFDLLELGRAARYISSRELFAFRNFWKSIDIISTQAASRILARLIWILVSVMMAVTASAQNGPTPPPRQDSQSPTGVSYRSGAFSYENPEISIGGEFPQGLSLVRFYNSSINSIFAQGYKTQGWTHNLVSRISNKVIPNPFAPPPVGRERWMYSVSVGNRSIGFLGGSTNPTGGMVGTYTSLQRNGTTLVFSGSEQNGHHTFVDSDGSILYFGSRLEGFWLQNWTAPDGTRLDFNYDANGLRSIFSTRGFALLFESAAPNAGTWTKICAVNLAEHYVTALSDCPVGVPATTLGRISSSVNPAQTLLGSATDASGRTTSYGYVGDDHLGCVTDGGASSCRISNTYNVCHRDPMLPQDPPNMRAMDQVVSQTTATGQTYTYSFNPSPQCPDPDAANPITRTMTSNTGAVTSVTTRAAGVPTNIIDPLLRSSAITYFPSAFPLVDEAAQVASYTTPEGLKKEYLYDARGNLTEERTKAKPGSGLPDRVASASYPVACVDRKTCNKPSSVTSELGNVTTYTYDAAHGGVLTETAPAALVNGAGVPVAPVKRYTYAQRFAWIKNAAGTGYVQAATPVWLLATESFCRASATVGAACATGAADEVMTTYEYGPDAGPNNLLLRGVAVTADGQTLRTCYGYDAMGRKISETKPAANLSACP